MLTPSGSATWSGSNSREYVVLDRTAPGSPCIERDRFSCHMIFASYIEPKLRSTFQAMTRIDGCKPCQRDCQRASNALRTQRLGYGQQFT